MGSRAALGLASALALLCADVVSGGDGGDGEGGGGGFEILGPGTVVPYQHPAQGRQRKDQMLVEQVSTGFFIGGSSIREMNGVYERVPTVHINIPHTVMGAYRKYPWDKEDDLSGWVLARVEKPEPGSGYEAVTDDPNVKDEWLIIDPQHRDRFAHTGKTRAPKSGRNWVHVHRHGGEGESQALAKEDDPSELPWKVVFLSYWQTTDAMRRDHLKFEQMQERSRQRPVCPKDCPCEHAGEQEDPPSVQEGEQLLSEGRFSEAAKVYDKELQDGCDWCEEKGVDAWWRAAVLRRWKAECLRRDGFFVQALEELDVTLSLYPKYRAAWLEVALTLLDAGLPETAGKILEGLLTIDAGMDGLDDWLVLAYVRWERAQRRRRRGLVEAVGEALAEVVRGFGLETEGVAVDRSTHYHVLGVAVDHSLEQLNQAFRRASRECHPDKGGGEEAAERFQRVAAAHELLGDAGARSAYDDGIDFGGDPLPRQRILTKFYPERYDWEPFGPFQEDEENRSQAV